MKPGSLPGKLLALCITAALLTLGLMFSAVLLFLILTVGTLVFIYLWWKTRALRRLMREQMNSQTMSNSAEAQMSGKGEIIEGEIISKVVTIDKSGDKKLYL